MSEEIKKTIVEALKAKKGKSKFYLKDFYSMVPDMKPREVKNIVNSMVQDGLLEYWSSGSTTMIGLKGAGLQAGAEGEGEE
ncbi:MAG: dissimilatory sulfite reductase D family protein [Pseudomonadota bacterium]